MTFVREEGGQKKSAKRERKNVSTEPRDRRGKAPSGRTAMGKGEEGRAQEEKRKKGVGMNNASEGTGEMNSEDL